MDNKKKTYGELSDLNLKVLISLSRCNQAVNKKTFNTMKKGGLTISQFAVLEVLYHKGDLRISEIIDKILSTSGNMTVVIDNLEKDELVKRSQDPMDRRASLISITDSGRALIEEIFPKHLENINELFNVLTLDEKKNLISTLKKLTGV
jgi:MarR family 2-MHQ and catechol resistance regulon transcriptional repressor